MLENTAAEWHAKGGAAYIEDFENVRLSTNTFVDNHAVDGGEQERKPGSSPERPHSLPSGDQLPRCGRLVLGEQARPIQSVQRQPNEVFIAGQIRLGKQVGERPDRRRGAFPLPGDPPRHVDAHCA